MRLLGLIAVGIVSMTVPNVVAAQERSVLVVSAGSREEAAFVRALRVHLEGSARVEEGRPLPPGSLAVRVQIAVQQVAEHGATLGVWIEPIRSEPEGGVILHVVRGDRSRALLEIVRVEAAAGDSGPVLHRELALRVAAILDLLQAVRSDLAIGIAPDRADRGGPGILIGAAAVGATGSIGPQAGAQLAGGVRLDAGGHPLDLRAVVRAFAGSDHPSDAGLVSLQEVDVGIEGRIGARRALGAAVGIELGIRYLSATGIAPSDDRGTASRLVPTARAIAEGSLELTPAIALRAEAAGELSLIHQRFLIGGQSAVDLGRFRFCVAGEIVLEFR